jgi:uncharacterized protein (DUF488 family)
VTDVYTIGHSVHPIDRFVALLKQHGIETLADVRSTPFSRRNPQFNKEKLSAALTAEGIDYVFLGKELGARSDDPAHYENDKVQYDRLAATASFKAGLDRVKAEAQGHRVALMCAEKEPLECHRTILVARRLAEQGLGIRHILADGTVEEHDRTLDRLFKSLRIEKDLLTPQSDLVEEAYHRQGERIAYRR